MTDIMEEDPSSGMQSSEEEVPVESLVRGRAKRSTAGLHMSALLEAAADDDLALLFEEVEDDNEFADEIDPEVEEDEGLESSDDDDDDQGPSATNDYEGEEQLQKDERKKRKQQNDLRFQTLRKRVKIDPTAINAVPAAPPRPKKKSERISWIPTVEDGPTRQSSRRQTMVNKEMTHARLKDSQEKRVRIIATMKEAEKRKAHLKPKKMTQEDHLAEAARVERLNSKSLNRWEQTERRKADERRARIEALQNRRLDGPVISYWSGVATWTNGRLTRVGKMDVKPKPDKEEAKKKKKEKEDKEKAAADQLALQSIPVFGPVPYPGPTPPLHNSNIPAAGTAAPVTPGVPAQQVSTSLLSTPAIPTPPGDKPPGVVPTPTPEPEQTPAVSTGTTDNVDTLAETPASVVIPSENDKGNAAEKQTPDQETNLTAPTLEKKEQAPDSTEQPTQSGQRNFAVEIPVRRLSGSSNNGSAQTVLNPTFAKNDGAMDIDQPSAPADVPKDLQAQEAVKANLIPSDNASAQPISAQEPKADPAGATPREQPSAGGASQPLECATSVGTGAALAPHIPATAAVSSATVPENAHLQSQSQQTWQPGSQPSNVMGPIQSGQVQPVQPLPPLPPAIPPPPPIIEQTGRTLTVLENFDHATAHSRKYSMYFNAKKPPRLTKISSSLCVITSMPSRYRDSDTGLPYANSYAYGQIRRLLSEGCIWSSMLGCFVGPADGAARGVPERFSGKSGPASVAVPVSNPVPEPLPVSGPGPGTVQPPALEGSAQGDDQAQGQAASIPNKAVAANGDLPTAQAPTTEPMDVDK
ncbi:uncharacterized protein N7511_005513 [Penicillium nucicola]|uniref:uncharacterized protein n=1 Tax=Penicillium nucicola TaxID=1850975 RepID=UPI0025451F43|nr:uncharacterized protein N7511_005513 [Penicillium nucicola]KAJ5762131.1 hypothetical protein N7511_005513 [Penicillium nucicola]